MTWVVELGQTPVNQAKLWNERQCTEGKTSQIFLNIPTCTYCLQCSPQRYTGKACTMYMYMYLHLCTVCVQPVSTSKPLTPPQSHIKVNQHGGISLSMLGRTLPFIYHTANMHIKFGQEYSLIWTMQLCTPILYNATLLCPL